MALRQFIDTKAVKEAIAEVRKERDELKRRQASLRVKEHRLKQILKQADD